MFPALHGPLGYDLPWSITYVSSCHLSEDLIIDLSPQVEPLNAATASLGHLLHYNTSMVMSIWLACLGVKSSRPAQKSNRHMAHTLRGRAHRYAKAG